MAKKTGLLIFILFMIDFITKLLILNATPFNIELSGFYKNIYPTFFPISEPTSFFNIILTWNNGVSFSMLSNETIWGRWLLVIMSMAVTVYVTYLLKQEKNKLNILGFIFIISGAIGNIFDRIRYGAVIDFLDFHINSYHRPAFNFADIFITIGVGFIILNYIKEYKKNKKGS